MATGTGTWVPEEQRDARWYIWHRKFMCRVNAFQCRTVEDIAQYGVPTSGDPLYDKAMQDEIVTRMLTINEMVELHRRGVNVGVKYADTRIIYEHISDHLMAWKQKLENGWHTRNAPIADLILLDQFANVVYKHARHQFTTEIVDSILARRMSGTLRVTRDRVMGSGLKVQVINKLDGEGGEEEKDPHAHLPERQSMAELFASKSDVANGASKWR